MRLHDIKSSLALRSALAHFGPFDAFSNDGKDIEVFKIEECEACGAKVKGANPVIIPSAQKWVVKWFMDSKMSQHPSTIQEICCNEEGECTCESCWCANENDKSGVCEV